jgi:SAM-dependent methyltransferase
MRAAEEALQTRRKLLVNLGSGPRRLTRLPAMFAEWREFRVDVDPGADPDLVADITDLSAIKSGTVDAVWSAHCIEHLYLHQVRKALEEAHRILADDGFLCLIVPDLQSIASYLVNDRLLDTVYQSAAGPRHRARHDVRLWPRFGAWPYPHGAQMRLHGGRHAAKIEGPVRRDRSAPPFQSRARGGCLQARAGEYGAAGGVADRAGAVISPTAAMRGKIG